MKKLVFFLLAVALFVGINIPTNSVFASAESVDFDAVPVMDDLLADTNFNIIDYPFSQRGNMAVVNFVEYCYSYRINQQFDYALYVYVYNPQGVFIDTSSRKNVIQFSLDGEGNYNKFVLKFCSMSSGDYAGLFYKFKVSNSDVLVSRVNSNARSYKVSGIELLTKGDSNATEYNVSTTYTYTGYAKGYGLDTAAESTLACNKTKLDTIQITDLGFSSYRFWNGLNSAQQISSVYFPVDERYFREYGALQKIRAQWYEYLLKPMFVTNNNDLYTALRPYLHTDIGVYTDSLDYSVATYQWANGNGGQMVSRADFAYNIETWYDNQFTRLDYLFYGNASDVDDVYISPAALENKIIGVIGWYADPGHGYSYKDANGYSVFDDTLIFENYVDEGRTRGFNDMTIDARDNINLVGADFGRAEWLYRLLYPDINYDDIDGFSPIYIIKENDLVGSDEDISNRLLVAVNDVPSIKTFYSNSKRNNTCPVIFRFASTEYYAEDLLVKQYSKPLASYCDWAYYAKETVFTDFDIIELTFNKEEVQTIIPVVSSPINVVGSIDPPPENVVEDTVDTILDKLKDLTGKNFEVPSWLKWLLLGLGIVVVALVLIPLMPYIVKFVVWLVCLPINAVKSISKAAKRRKRNNYYDR